MDGSNPKYTEPPDALEELTALTSGLAHEIRTPLPPLKTNLRLRAGDGRGRGRGDEVRGDRVRRSLARLETTIRGGAGLAGFLDRFLRYAARHEMEREPQDLNQFV